MATPLTAGTGFVAHASVAPLVPVPGSMERAMASALPLMTLPPASLIATTGWIPNTAPPEPPGGCAVKAIDVAAGRR